MNGNPAYFLVAAQPPFPWQVFLALQPPLPWQEFLPLQPLSPVLQPPFPLQVFLPAQSCTSFESAARKPAAETFELSGVEAVAALS